MNAACIQIGSPNIKLMGILRNIFTQQFNLNISKTPPCDRPADKLKALSIVTSRKNSSSTNIYQWVESAKLQNGRIKKYKDHICDVIWRGPFSDICRDRRWPW